MKKLFLPAAIIILLSLVTPFAQEARGADLLPSADFEFGGRLDIWGQEVSQAINAASVIGMQWIAIDFNWQRQWPDLGSPVDLSQLDAIMTQARQANLQVLLSLSNPPTWGLTSEGPNTGYVSEIVYQFAVRYPDTLGAIELFPAANTLLGWGAKPDARAYTGLYSMVRERLDQAKLDLLLVAGGFSPLTNRNVEGDIEDLAFLEAMFQTDIQIPVIGLRLDLTSGNPLSAPLDGSHLYLRHFEEVRDLMRRYNQGSNQIWITSFSWPNDGTISSEEQPDWLSQAFRLLRSRLYIQAAFFSPLNPPENSAQPSSALILPNASLHPACAVLSQFIAAGSRLHTTSFHGSVSKRTSAKLELKPERP